MDETKKNIRELLRDITKDNSVEVYSVLVKITAVDETARTCDVEPLNGDAEIFDIRLQSTLNGSVGVVLVPKVGSVGVITFINNTTGYLAQTSELDKILIDCESITFNGGSFGGLIKIDELITKINALENDINSLKTVFSTWVPVPQDGGASLKTASASWSGQQITPTQKTDLENDKIKH